MVGAVARSHRILIITVTTVSLYSDDTPMATVTMAAGAPELLLAVGLKMYCQLWMTTGRGFNSLLAGLSGFAHAHPHAGDMLRTVRAVCVRDVCRHDSTRGLELVRAVQVNILT